MNSSRFHSLSNAIAGFLVFVLPWGSLALAEGRDGSSGESAPPVAQGKPGEFKFPKGAKVTVISPLWSQLVAYALPEGFQGGPSSDATNPKNSSYIRETVLKGESITEWTQMITVQGWKDKVANEQVAPQRFVEGLATMIKRDCSDSFAAAPLYSGKISDYDAFGAILSCGASPVTGRKTSETFLIVVVKGERDLYSFQWAERAMPSQTPIPIDLKKWRARFDDLQPIKLCSIVKDEPAPYQSCTGAGAIQRLTNP